MQKVIHQVVYPLSNYSGVVDRNLTGVYIFATTVRAAVPFPPYVRDIELGTGKVSAKI